MSRFVTPCVIALALAVAACGSDSKTACDPAAQTGCGTGAVCEQVQNGPPACFDPVVVAGKVFDLAAPTTAIAQARVVALDANRAPVSAVALTDADGTYRIQVPQTRRADGTPSSGQVTLRVDHAGYQTFPGGVRVALPIDASAATHASGAWTVQSTLTDVGLLALPAGAGNGSIYGKVALPPDHGGVLVVAETSVGSAVRGSSAIADRDGSFAVLNLTPGDYTVRAYALGQNYEAKPVTVAAAQQATVQLAIASAARGAVSGNVQIVNPGQGSVTSVILVPESTFDAALARGDAPPGLRAANVSNAFSIAGVPDGRYVALAAFEDDFLVRDPSNIGGTAIPHLTVANGTADTSPSFKVTGALDVVSPGANGPETVKAATPTFTWVDDSSEKSYRVTVLDAFGQTVWEASMPGVTGSAHASVAYGQSTGGVTSSVAALPLQPGMYYQFRAVSLDGTGTALSQTEDLKGVFLYQP